MTNIYNQTKEKVKLEINQAKCVCITSDGRMSQPNENFLALTIHVLNLDADLKAYMLECIQFSHQHTADTLSQELKGITDDWCIYHKIVAATTDNANNMKAAIKICNWKQIPCFAHTFNLIVQSGQREIKDTTTKIKHIIDLFKTSLFATARL